MIMDYTNNLGLFRPPVISFWVRSQSLTFQNQNSQFFLEKLAEIS